MNTTNDPEPGLVLLVFRPLSDAEGLDWAIRLRHLLKRALRSWRLQCVEARLLDADGMAPAPADAAEVARLQVLVEDLADRCAGQAELLAKRAERQA